MMNEQLMKRMRENRENHRPVWTGRSKRRFFFWRLWEYYGPVYRQTKYPPTMLTPYNVDRWPKEHYWSNQPPRSDDHDESKRKKRYDEYLGKNDPVERFGNDWHSPNYNALALSSLDSRREPDAQAESDFRNHGCGTYGDTSSSYSYGDSGSCSSYDSGSYSGSDGM